MDSVTPDTKQVDLAEIALRKFIHGTSLSQSLPDMPFHMEIGHVRENYMSKKPEMEGAKISCWIFQMTRQSNSDDCGPLSIGVIKAFLKDMDFAWERCLSKEKGLFVDATEIRKEVKAIMEAVYDV